MVEFFLPHLVTAISTIIAVTMATLFFCCWRKKGARETVDGKSGPAKDGVKKQISVSPVPAAVERAENGLVAASTSTPTLVVSSDDLGDFSAVQRETEILRSYRKPPPPRNRARHSKAPRHLMNDGKSTDVFTEISEEDGNALSPDEPDSALLRSHSVGKERSTRETHSSMLMDIEDALATLQTSEPPTEGSISEDTQSPTQFSLTVTKDVQDEKLESEIRTGDFRMTTSKSCPTETLSPPEITSEVAVISAGSSPKIPHAKPKQGPKVSPKPSPRASARMSSLIDRPSPTGTIESEKQSEPSVINSLNLHKVLDNIGGSHNKVTPLQDSASYIEVESNVSEMLQKSTSLEPEAVENLKEETPTNNIQQATQLDHVGSGVMSSHDTNFTDELKAVKCSITNTSENPASDKVDDADVSNAGLIIRESNSTTEVAVDSDPSSQGQEETKTQVCDDKDSDPVPKTPPSDETPVQTDCGSSESQDENGAQQIVNN